MTRLTCLLEPTSEARRRGYPTGREEQCAAARHLRPPAAAAAAAAAVEEDDDEVTGLSSTVHWAVGPLRGWRRQELGLWAILEPDSDWAYLPLTARSAHKEAWNSRAARIGEGLGIRGQQIPVVCSDSVRDRDAIPFLWPPLAAAAAAMPR